MVRKKTGRADTRTRLLDATLMLISEKGYLGATTREIASRAGVTEITLFRHFGSKEKLFEEVLRTYTFLPKLKELLPELEEKNYEDALTIVGLKLYETLGERKSMVKIMLSEMNVYPEKVRNVYKKFIDELIGILAGYLRRLQKMGEIRKFNPRIGARSFLGVIFSYFQAEEIIRSRTVPQREVKRFVREFVGIFVSGTKQMKGGR
ncbi:HTH-type transcriptional repressor KstR2 [bacterium BMS3Bbin06]|nr:HTH-type transcriptional repressor KstR2 [bacterium BMS3Bbin06]HDO35973.1 TetR/AcrR family transcriptional regulator [Nitrospirota bacterium]HDY70751.1 TetR/AcrR family transcriptional regulator [Nitrospirota bacterium]